MTDTDKIRTLLMEHESINNEIKRLREQIQSFNARKTQLESDIVSVIKNSNRDGVMVNDRILEITNKTRTKRISTNKKRDQLKYMGFDNDMITKILSATTGTTEDVGAKLRVVKK